jgi:hypothetical protein
MVNLQFKFVGKERKFTYEPRQAVREKSAQFNIIMKTENSYNYMEERKAEDYFAHKGLTQDNLTMTNLTSNSVYDLSSSTGMIKLEKLNEEYTDWQTGTTFAFTT